MKKLSFLMALLMIVSALAGCSDTSAETETLAADTAAAETEPAETEIPDNLPDMDYGGADYRIYTRNCLRLPFGPGR